MNKEKIIKEIENLPLFELIDLGVRKNEEDEYVKQPQSKAVVFLGKTESLAYVSSTRYKLFQFKEVFLPIVEKIDAFDGVLKSYLGRCLLEINPDQEEFTDGNTKYGLTILNSVDKSTSITVKFNVTIGNNTLCFPKSMAAYSKTHSSKGLILVKNYTETILKVQTAWKNIIEHFPKIKIPDDEYNLILDNFSLSKTTKTKIAHNQKWKNETYSLWDVIEFRLDEISKKEYKSPIHKSNALDKLASEIWNYAVASGI